MASTLELNHPTCLCTDWSKERLGFTLLQKHCRCSMLKTPYCCNDGWHLIYAGSRVTTPAESRYTPVEGEALAVAYALEKCHMFVMGCSDIIANILGHIPPGQNLPGQNPPDKYSPDKYPPCQIRIRT